MIDLWNSERNIKREEISLSAQKVLWIAYLKESVLIIELHDENNISGMIPELNICLFWRVQPRRLQNISHFHSSLNKGSINMWVLNQCFIKKEAVKMYAVIVVKEIYLNYSVEQSEQCVLNECRTKHLLV